MKLFSKNLFSLVFLVNSNSFINLFLLSLFFNFGLITKLKNIIDVLNTII